MPEDEKYKLDIALPNGVIMTLIGLLVIMSPLASDLTKKQVSLDYLAGGILMAAGIVSIGWGIIRRKNRKENHE